MTLRRIAFDLDETLGVPALRDHAITGWNLRPGAADLLDRLSQQYTLVLWSVSARRYVDKALAAGLSRWFAESYSWDECPAGWKDIRRYRLDLLVDDSPHHGECAAREGLTAGYVVVPAFGSPEDAGDPPAWMRLVEAAVARL